ncbi:MAG: response regulator [Candidatus Sulfotelmatobacter sp.]|jgi:DNA-binding NarL/FixJ family response regulator
MENIRRTTFEMHTLLLCKDVQFLGITRTVLNQLQVTPKIVGGCDAALAMIQQHEFDVIIVDWREIDNLGDFLSALRKSKLNHECVLVAIMRDLLDLRQAFAAGVHFLIHKPASAVQIERCLRAAYCATVVRRRKHHREKVDIVASLSTRMEPFTEATVVNLSEGGMGLRTDSHHEMMGVTLSPGEEVDLRFALPETDSILHTTGRVVWTTTQACGIRFSYVPDDERAVLEQWLTACVERSLAELCVRMRGVCA